tara:strand:- start:966 stop:2576 length:1611 start_codon:yes stop_codon:yes gene_type:complete
MSDEKIWYESIHELNIDESKVKNFYYPIKPGETIEFREGLAVKLVNLLRELKKYENSYFDECVASLFGIINEAVNIYYTIVLKNKLKQNNFKIIPDHKSRLLKNILINENPDFPKILKQLIKGKDRVKKRYFLLRYLKNFLTEKKIIKNYFKLPNFEKDIACIGYNEFLETHAKFEKKKVYYVRINEWFKKLDKPFGNDNDLNFVSNNIVEIILNEFTKNEIILDKNLKSYFKEIVNLLLFKLSLYKKSILESEIGLPKVLWTPSGGGIFANIFRQVCKSKGSKVVGHAHGSGTGYFSDYGRTLSILEYQSCTEFFVYTKKNINEYIKFSRKDLVIDQQLPNIKSINSQVHWHHDKLNNFQKLFNKKERERYILYIPSIFINDNYYDGKLIDAHNTYNWLLKVSNFLKKNNFKFKIKLHPEKKTPDKFIKYYKENICDEKLAYSIYNSSLIITDQPSSTSFSAAVVSDKPIIFLDLKVQDFSDLAWTLLKKRCSVLEGNFTKDGITINWDMFYKKILKPKTDFTNEFKNTYFENLS